MKPDGNKSSFNLVLTISLLALAILCIQYYFKTKELRTFQTTVATYQSRRAQLNALLGELVEYSKRNSAIDPLLKSEGIPVDVARGNSPAPAAPAKPATK